MHAGLGHAGEAFSADIARNLPGLRRRLCRRRRSGVLCGPWLLQRLAVSLLKGLGSSRTSVCLESICQCHLDDAVPVVIVRMGLLMVLGATTACCAQVYTGGIDNSVKVWDLRKEQVVLTLSGHSDTITGMAVSPNGSHLLTNSMDNTLREWDMRPYAAENRCTKALPCFDELRLLHVFRSSNYEHE